MAGPHRADSAAAPAEYELAKMIKWVSALVGDYLPATATTVSARTVFILEGERLYRKERLRLKWVEGSSECE